ncbi:NUDIX hydrolase [Paenibacillus sp. FSL W7-1287]|uniref:NUDIX hydrolase n=1 Tax=Paenibacillus sp. FSL W7-1287 TaxID=2954538 RepID=UPI0030F8CA64
MMISFDVGESQKFSVRAVAIIIKEDRILFQQFNNSEYWFLPGGRVEMMEELHETIEREISEEYGWSIKNKKLVWLVENFFNLDNIEFHELGFYFLVQVEDKLEIMESDFHCLEGISVSRWFRISELNQHPVVPDFVKQGIDVEQLRTTNEVKHIINRG